MNTKPIILLAGSPKHGKSLAASMIGDLTGKKFANTSDVIYERLCVTRPGLVTSNDKEAIRSELIKIGDGICKNDPSAILKILVSRGFVIIAGVRKPAELEDFRRCHKCIVVWISRNSGVIPDNTMLEPHDADFVVDNSGSEEQLRSNLVVVLKGIEWPLIKDY